MRAARTAPGGLALWAGGAGAVLHFAGALKSLPVLAALPFDLTLAALLALAPAAVFLLLRRRWWLDAAIARPLLAALLLLLWLVLAACWSESRRIAEDKLLAMLLLGPPLLLAGLLVGGDRGACRAFAAAALAIGALAGAAIAWGVATDSVVLGGEVGADPDRVRVQYQITGLAIAAAAGLAAVRAAEAPGAVAGLGWLALTGLLAAAVLVPGGRLGLVGLVAAVVAAPATGLWLAGRVRGALLWCGGFVALALLALAMLLLDPGAAQGFRTLERVVNDPGTVTVARLLLWGEALRWGGAAAPFGLGTGGFAIAAGFGEDRGFYPHNHALEAMAEGGLPGLALWLGAFGGAVVLAMRRGAAAGPGRAARIAAISLPLALSLMVSTDLGNRMAWFGLGLVLSLAVEARPWQQESRHV